MDSQELYDKAIDNVKNGGSVYISTPLNGELNLRGNKEIAELHFTGGQIERIYNVPRTLKKLVINNNRLIDLPSLEFPNLIHLEVQNNKLSKLDLQTLTNLAYLNAMNNPCTIIDNIPDTLKYLYADNNKLKSLNLNNASMVRVSCQGNPSLKKITGAQHAGSINKDTDTQIVSGTHMAGGTKHDVQEAVDEYYKLKSLYESSIKGQKDKIQCINCKKLGGTKFWKDAKGHLRAICGNSSQPCKLDIDILASLNEVQYQIDRTKQHIEETKQDIVKLKMDTIFGYVSEAESVKQFEQLKKQLMDETDASLLNDNKYSYYELVNDSERQRVVNAKQQGIHQELGEIRSLLNNYNRTGRDKLMKDIALKHQTVNDQMNIIRGLKYPVCEVIQVKGLNVLKQYPYSIDTLHNKHADLLKVEKYQL